MLRRDYFIRKLEEFSKALAALLLLKKSGDWEKFEEEARETIQKFSSVDLNEVEAMNPETLHSEIVHTTKLSIDDKKILAAILFEKLDYYALQEQEENYKRCAAQCLQLYTYLQADHTENEFDLEVHYRLKQLQKIVS